MGKNKGSRLCRLLQKLDDILKLNGHELLTHAGRISYQMAIQKSESEYEKFKEEQKQLGKEENLKEIEEDIKKLKKLRPK